MKDKWHEPITVPYLRERICSCDMGFRYADDFNWDRCFEVLTEPPLCANCGRWMDRVHTCIHCHQQYYQFFWHPLMGRESSIEKFPWECWDCLETWHRWVPCPGTIKVPPPPVVLVPNRVPQVMEYSSTAKSVLEQLRALREG